MRELTKSWAFWLVLALAVLWWVVPAKSEEQVLVEATVGQGGLICDQPEEVEAYIGLVESGTSAQDALQEIAGCGILMRPALMRVVAVKVHETEKFKYLLVRFDFLGTSLPPQFGVHSVMSKGQDV